MASTNQPNGLLSSTHPAYQPKNWTPAELLNPKAPASSSASSAARSRQSRPMQNGAGTADSLTFQFSSTSDAPSPQDPAPRHSADLLGHGRQHSSTLPQGMGSMIERMNNVEDRAFAPAPKRRRIEEDVERSQAIQLPRSGGSGILGQYMRDKRQEGRATPSVAEGESVPTVTRVESVDLTGGDDDEVVIVDMQNEEVCYGMVEGASVNCHKVPAPKPGMRAIGGPGYWPQVKVILKRTVGDKTNTIQVYDHTREIFGNVDPKTSAGLAQLLDSRTLELRTDCLIPTRRRQPDEEIGKPISRGYKVNLMLYGKFKFAKTVGRYLAIASLNLLSPPRVEAGIRVFNPLAKENRPSLASRAGLSNGPSYEQYAPPPIARTVEEIRSDVMTVFDSLTQSENLPEIEPNERILTPLLRHQKQALYFMTTREDLHTTSSPGGPADSIWQEKRGNSGQTYYRNIVTGQQVRQPPLKTLGGILADMMGLGKTLSVLSLVTYTLEEASQWARSEPSQPRAPEKRQSHSSNRFHPPTPEPLGLTPVRRNAKSTLLICPLSTVTNWEEQLKQHIQPGGLTYHIYHGQHRIKDPAALCKFDLVITTYGSVSSELNARSKGKKGPHPLEEVGWFRIVLDEAHMIREQSTLQFKSICRLQASRRWAVTGTPVQNKLDDLAALLAFLRLKPFDDRSNFMQYIVAPFKLCDPEIVPKLRILVDTITLRRLKDKIDLPKRTDQIVKLKFSADEQRLYDMFAKHAQDRVHVLTDQRQRILGGKTYIHILQAILRLRLICAHGKDLLNEEDLEVLQGMTKDSAIDLDSDSDDDKAALPEKKAYDLFDLMKETNADVCITCNRKLGSNDAADIESERQEDVLGYMTPCFHLLCPSCISEFRDDLNGASHNSKAYGNCPFCQSHVRFACVELRETRAATEHESHTKTRAKGHKSIEGYSQPHTKTKALIEELLKAKAESEAHLDEPPLKSVVFSGWTSHLDLIQIALDRAGIVYTRLDGKMSRPARTQAMDRFREDPFVQVILVSITAGGLGLNLTAANTVYVMEPQYNPAAEAQAIDRVHRLGQKREVRTVRYIMQDSFEEKMLELQDKKIKLASLSMDGSREGRDAVISKAEAARQRLMDLRSLFR
ncbi:SNF2 family domain-containing protein [Pleurostoma richardsiae]|uniref:SNF2 family domain-containing protein n=1 Tax=Pleurostoma richardsiae TaxID=41990 RepID=A0AA38R138_9PEZI|nr:SNF2 family domain-containing protein [Pleurostoma richardsiae]